MCQVGISLQDRMQCILLLSNKLDYYLELSTKLLSTKESYSIYIEPLYSSRCSRSALLADYYSRSSLLVRPLVLVT